MSATLQPPLLIDAGQAAKLLSVCRRTVLLLTERGELACVRVGRRVLLDPTDLRAWIARVKVHAIAAPESALASGACECEENADVFNSRKGQNGVLGVPGGRRLGK